MFQVIKLKNNFKIKAVIQDETEKITPTPDNSTIRPEVVNANNISSFVANASSCLANN